MKRGQMTPGDAEHPPIPWYVVKRIKLSEHPDLDARSVLKVTCTQCLKWHIVKLTWVKGRYRTRPCPHCFRTSFVPFKAPK